MTRQARVGLVILVGLVLFGAAIFGVANRSFLFSDRVIVKSHFNQVSGLRSGADVQFQGVSVGAVESVALPATTGGQIEVSMAIRSASQHLIHDSTQAQIKTEGLLGQMIVVLVNPPPAPGMSEPQGLSEARTIRGVDPFDLFEITDKALASVQRFEQSATAVERIVEDVRNGEGTLGKLVYDPALYTSLVDAIDASDRLLGHLGDNAQALVDLAREATEGVQSILSKVDEGDGTLARLLNDPAAYDRVLATMDSLEAITTNLRALAGGAENLLNWGSLGAFRFAELMEAGKHNWLFKRYFEERGYMEPASFEVREQAISESFLRLQDKERELLLWEERLTARAALLDSALQSVQGPSGGAQQR